MDDMPAIQMKINPFSHNTAGNKNIGEKWFNIIMGEKYKVDAFSTDKYAERIPLPQELAEELAFRLDVDWIQNLNDTYNVKAIS